MAKIFISYRRDDSAGYAGRLYDRLAGHFGRDHVFMDIDQIEPGEVFDNVIREKLATVQAAVVLIGKHWLNITDANGQRRLDHPDDWVRLEITALLEREIRVIPVLVGGAAMPKLEQLPECLMPLTRRQALEITSHACFHGDTGKLIKALEKIMGAPTPPRPEPPKQPEQPGFPRFAAIAGVIVVLAAWVYYWVMSPEPTPVQPETVIPKTISQLVTDPSKIAVIEPKMVRIPPGKFLMDSEDGNSNEQPIHEVTIGYAFEIGKYEVTFDEYDAFAKATHRKFPSDEIWGRGIRPVINVSFDDAQAYVQWLSLKTGKKYRLPTEAEWEYAARASTETHYWWGDDIGSNNANCYDCGSQWDSRQTAPVGSFKANTYGLYDTAGNVYEWVLDCWHESYHGAPGDGSAWLDANGGDCTRRVIRGGSWGIDPLDLRSADRNWDYSDGAYNYLGFRVARDF